MKLLIHYSYTHIAFQFLLGCCNRLVSNFPREETLNQGKKNGGHEPLLITISCNIKPSINPWHIAHWVQKRTYLFEGKKIQKPRTVKNRHTNCKLPPWSKSIAYFEVKISTLLIKAS